ncbi:hypothetical protein LJR168_001379 [Pseudoxanthomonas sp. LjRoot168]|uniref:hypothetical protein n=1 Tax=unclassified Pseudoxanthomonas TaxID=2645906 RepID=UPI003ECE6CC1
MSATNYVLRSVYLEPEIDNFLREQAFNLAVSKNDLIRRYVLAGAKAELEKALQAPVSSKLSNSIPTGVLKAARVANLIPASGDGSSVQVKARTPSPAGLSHKARRQQKLLRAVSMVRGAAMKKAAAEKVAAQKPVKKIAKKRLAKA